MEFPITDLLDDEQSQAWIVKYFHPEGLKCRGCVAPVEQAHVFRTTQNSRLTVYRCNDCLQPYNVYSRTIFQQRHLRPQQVILLVRGVLKGEPSTTLAAELALNYKTVLALRRLLQANAQDLQSNDPLADEQTESDEMFQNAGEKRG
jgi:hypothetical protein